VSTKVVAWRGVAGREPGGFCGDRSGLIAGKPAPTVTRV